MNQDHIGEYFGNYQLISLLGCGGFAEVYLGQHVRLSKQVAVKLLRATPSTEEIENFQREAEIIASLNHPNIVNVFDFDLVRGIPFLVMDYYPNGTLRRRHPKGKRVPLPMVVSYIKQIADALQYAHDQRQIHRDVKPENMLVGRGDTILLSDFGIATIAHGTSSMSVQAVTGTIPYMAPEQIQAKARPASDQYALAIVAYEWLAGERPFGGSYTEVFAKQLNAPPPPLHDKIPALAPEVEQVILKALAKDPKQRFATIETFASALEAASLSDRRSSVTKTIPPSMSQVSMSGEANLQSRRDAGNPFLLWPAGPLGNVDGQLPGTFKNTMPAATTFNSSLRKVPDKGRRRIVALLATGGGVAAAGLGFGAFELLYAKRNTSSPQTATTRRQPTDRKMPQTRQGTTGTGTNTPQQNHTGVVIGMTNMAINSSKTFTNPADGVASLLVHLPDGNFVAYESTCTHQQVTVYYDPGTQTINCPAHGSIFDPANSGAVLQDPATKPLPSVAVRVNGDGTVTTG